MSKKKKNILLIVGTVLVIAIIILIVIIKPKDNSVGKNENLFKYFTFEEEATDDTLNEFLITITNTYTKENYLGNIEIVVKDANGNEMFRIPAMIDKTFASNEETKTVVLFENGLETDNVSFEYYNAD